MKRTRLQKLKKKNWFIPPVYALTAIVIGMILPRVENRFWPGLTSTISISAAMNICSAVASGMLSLTGIVFSLTFVRRRTDLRAGSQICHSARGGHRDQGALARHQ